MGISGAMFWPSLIAWLAGSSDEKSLLLEKLTRFNIIWCIGAAIGPLIAGVLFQVNSRLPFYLAVFVSFVTVLLILRKPHEISKESHLIPEHICLKKIDCGPQRKPCPKSTFSCVYAAWIANFVTYFSVGIISLLVPPTVNRNRSPTVNFENSNVFIIVSQDFTFYLLGRGSRWHHQSMFLIHFQLLEVIGLMLILLSNFPFLFVVAFILIEAGAGMTYFLSIFYSLSTHQNKGTKSGVHIAMVGGGGLVGPLVGEVLGQVYTLKPPIYM